ncbi:MAG: nuclear transport factor 2 family protein [Dongiaceae bacterium]
MAITRDYVESLFRNLETGNRQAFFDKMADDVEVSIMGNHTLAATYRGKEEFLTKAHGRINRIRNPNVPLKISVRHVLVSGDHGIVEMHSISTALNGKPIENTYCWICRFEGDKIREVRSYTDTASMEKAILENEADLDRKK